MVEEIDGVDCQPLINIFLGRELNSSLQVPTPQSGLGILVQLILLGVFRDLLLGTKGFVLGTEVEHFPLVRLGSKTADRLR